MPIPASQLELDSHCRLCVIGESKVAKSTRIITTSPNKPVRVLLCEDDKAMQGAWERTKEFEIERCVPDAMGKVFDLTLRHIVQAKDDAKKKKIGTVVLDPVSLWAPNLLEECFALTRTNNDNEDGRQAHQLFTRKFKHAINLLLTVPADLIIISHWLESKKPTTGRLVVPNLPNDEVRKWLPSVIHDIVWFDKAEPGHPVGDDRVFVTEIEGVIGPGCRSRRGAHILPADVRKFIEWAKTPDLPKRPATANNRKEA